MEVGVSLGGLGRRVSISSYKYNFLFLSARVQSRPPFQKKEFKNSVIFYLGEEGVEIFKHGCALKNNILSLKIAFIQDIFAPILSANLFKHHHNAEEPGRPAHLHRL